MSAAAKHTPARICRVCDASIDRDAGRCTNGCCGVCHARHCTPGGVTSPGHGLNVERARAAIAKATGSAA